MKICFRTVAQFKQIISLPEKKEINILRFHYHYMSTLFCDYFHITIGPGVQAASYPISIGVLGVCVCEADHQPPHLVPSYECVELCPHLPMCTLYKPNALF